VQPLAAKIGQGGGQRRTLARAPQAQLSPGRLGRLITPRSPVAEMAVWGKEKNT
jgi:hypothetical protein